MGRETKLPTHFASAERAADGEILEQFIQVSEAQQVRELLDSIPNVTVILNEHRQIVFANKSLVDFLGLKYLDDVRGKRPGEAVNCVHSSETPGGCGTTEHCSTCGAVLAILTTQREGTRDVRECRITRKKGEFEEAVDFRVWTEEVKIEDRFYTLLSIMNISDEKRRQVLEQIFFHDVRNTMSVLLTSAELAKAQTEDPQLSKLTIRTCALIEQLTSEIDGQQQLLAAEKNELSVKPGVIRSRAILEQLVCSYSENPLVKQKTIKISEDSTDILFESDELLLYRVLNNMLKNALEATKRGDTITLGCSPEGNSVKFWVNNPGAMSREVQLQMFQRSFSTKGGNRGIGTYSMKLLTQRYLKGSIRFESDKESGTTFIAEYPLSLS